MNPRHLLLIALNCGVAGSLSASIGNSQELQGYAAVVNQGHIALSSASGFALDSLSAGSGFHVGYAYNDVETDPVGSDRSFDTEINQSSGSVAYVHQFAEITSSLSVSYIDSDTEANYSDSGSLGSNVGTVALDADGWIVSGAVADTWGQFTLSVLAGVGQLSESGVRHSLFGKIDSSFDTDLYYMTVEGNYAIFLSERMTLAPFAKLNYLNVSSDSFSESGGNDPRKVDSIERDWITGEFGLRSLLNVSDALSASLALSLEHDFDSSETELSGADLLVLPPVVRGVNVPDVGETRLKAGVGVDYRLSESWVLAGDFSYANGDDYDAFGAGGTLSYTF